MTKEQCLETLLTQLVRSIVYENIPSKTEIVKFHTFLNNLGVFEAQHPVHATAALEDWVPRLLDGIATSSRLTIQHPPLMLQASTQQSTLYMDSVLDAMATVPQSSSNPCCHTALIPEPRFTVRNVIGHKIEGGKLSYWVQWEGNDFYEAEVYKNLHHLAVFKQYEASIVPIVPIGTRVRGSRQKAKLDSYEDYLRLRDEAISQLTEEFDTEDEDDQVAVTQQDYLTGSPMEHISSDDTISWGDLLVAEDALMPSNLDLGGSFGAAGPSYQGELFSWRD
jgi:hypothetical protein